jgi:glucose/arabinose dehydrogenase/PKD repeat protein
VSVQFYADGSAVGLKDFEAPYGVDWDTRNVPNGAHVLTARARDAASNAALSAPITVNVANASFFQNEILATGFDLPTNIEFLPDARMLVGEIAGIVKVLPPPYTTPDSTPFLDLDIDIAGYAGLQQGIFDIALDPNFTSNHFYYVFYTNDSPNRDRLSRFTANAALDGTIPGSEVILYEDPQASDTEHHGGAVNFGNDGKIYFTTGEHFNASNAQDLTSPRGKIHRINPDGTVPTDNPFHDGAGPNRDSIWAYGLRNPFRAYYDVPTSRLLVADVGGNDYSTAQEEVDLGARGANYGWPNCELGTCGNPGYTAGIYAYPHLGRDASITGGFVYHGSAFPSSYQGRYFFADYTQNWIKSLTFDAQGNVDGIFNFEPADGASDGAYGDIVYLAEGPDGALYYVDLGYSDVGGTFGISKIRRIRYIQSNLPPTAIASASPTSGPAPLTVTFSSAGSFDPELQPITYLWTFGDGATSSEANPVHTYAQDGPYVARLTVSDNVNTTLGDPFTISVGNAPTCVILTPNPNSTFIAGDVILFSGEASDTEDGVLPASAYVWNIDFLHEGHVHPGPVHSGVTSGTFTIPTSGHDFSGDTRYRISLRVTDSDGLQGSAQAHIYPQKVDLSFDTIPSGVTLYLDGIAKATPFVYDALINFQHSIEARNSSSATTVYTFQSWSDGGAQLHTITVPASDQSYSATYRFTIGETTVFGSTDSGNGNLLLVQDAVLSRTATIQSFSFHVLNAAGNLRLGIYDATGPSGGPGALRAQTSSFAPVVGWNTQSVITPVSLPAGNYWLAYFPSSSSHSFATNFSIGSYKAASLPFGSMPATFPANFSGGITHWSLYGTLTP